MCDTNIYKNHSIASKFIIYIFSNDIIFKKQEIQYNNYFLIHYPIYYTYYILFRVPPNSKWPRTDVRRDSFNYMYAHDNFRCLYRKIISIEKIYMWKSRFVTFFFGHLETFFMEFFFFCKTWWDEGKITYDT